MGQSSPPQKPPPNRLFCGSKAGKRDRNGSDFHPVGGCHLSERAVWTQVSIPWGVVWAHQAIQPPALPMGPNPTPEGVRTGRKRQHTQGGRKRVGFPPCWGCHLSERVAQARILIPWGVGWVHTAIQIDSAPSTPSTPCPRPQIDHFWAEFSPPIGGKIYADL